MEFTRSSDFLSLGERVLFLFSKEAIVGFGCVVIGGGIGGVFVGFAILHALVVGWELSMMGIDVGLHVCGLFWGVGIVIDVLGLLSRGHGVEGVDFLCTSSFT